MYTFEEIGEMLDDIVDSIPNKFLRELTGGIYLKHEFKHNDRIPSDQYFVLGQYFYSPILGSWIYIYYGSVMALYIDAAPEEVKSRLRETVEHELQHHIERLAGQNTLEREDNRFVQESLIQVKQGRRITHERI